MDTVYRIVFAFLHLQTTLPSLNLIHQDSLGVFFVKEKKREKFTQS